MSRPWTSIRKNARARQIMGGLRDLFSSREFTAGFIIFASLVMFSTVGSALVGYDPMASVGPPNIAPNSQYLFGTDSFGRDVMSQILHGIQLSLIVALLVSTVDTFFGSTVGFVAGYYGGLIGSALGIIMDVMLVVPILPAIVLITVTVRKVELWLMAMILSLFGWAAPARQVRSQTLSLKAREFIDVAKISGARRSEILFVEIVPHMLQWMSAHYVYDMLWAILTEASVEVLGLGPQHMMTLGMMLFWVIRKAAMYRNLWWWWITPIAVLICLFVSLYLMHRGLDRMVNPRLRGRR